MENNKKGKHKRDVFKKHLVFFPPPYLCDGKIQTDIDDDSEEKYVEGPYNQERLLQHQDLIEVIMNLEIRY